MIKTSTSNKPQPEDNIFYCRAKQTDMFLYIEQGPIRQLLHFMTRRRNELAHEKASMELLIGSVREQARSYMTGKVLIPKVSRLKWEAKKIK